MPETHEHELILHPEEVTRFVEDLLPILFVIIIWGGIIRSIAKTAKKNQPGKGGPVRSQQASIPGRKSAPKGRKNPWEAERNQDSVPAKGAEKSFQAVQTMMPLDALSRSQETSSLDQGRMHSGSLQVEHGEGYDPCHDDPSEMPLGSLRADIPEGTDPCHAGMEPARPTVQAKTGEDTDAAPGFRLGYSGNDIVQGFVWGEILNRKRA